MEKEILKKDRIDTIQINLGDKCNMVCTHCHIGASPQENKKNSSGGCC